MSKIEIAMFDWKEEEDANKRIKWLFPFLKKLKRMS